MGETRKKALAPLCDSCERSDAMDRVEDQLHDQVLGKIRFKPLGPAPTLACPSCGRLFVVGLGYFDPEEGRASSEPACELCSTPKAIVARGPEGLVLYRCPSPGCP